MSIAKKYGLAEIFQDGMLFQRNKDIVLWGCAKPDTRVTVSLYRERKAHADEKAVLSGSGTADENGNFRITLPPREAGEGYLLCVDFDTAPEESICLKHIGFGDIWLAGGQSNMEFFLKYDRDWEETKKLPRNPRIRMYNVPQRAFDGHTTHNKTGYGYWFDDRDPALETFSAPAYSFAREVQAAAGIPIGIIGCNWGGSSASAWVDEEVLSAPPLDRYLREYEEAVAGIPAEKLAADSLAGWEFEDSARHGADFEPLLYGRDRDWQLNYMKIHAGEPVVPMGPYNFNRPSGLYRTMLSNLIPFSIRGVLWYQGESDAGDYASLYDKLLTGLIESWRRAWDDDFPFLIVQLAPFGQWLDCDSRGYATVREKQTYVSQNVPGVHMATIMDLGSRYDIHPKEKMEVGRRLALLARGHVSGETELLCDPPEATSAVRLGGRQIAVNFRHEDGLFADGKRSDWRIGLKTPTALAGEDSTSENGRTDRNVRLQKQHIVSAENTIEGEPSTQSAGSQEGYIVPAENTIEGEPSGQNTGSQDQWIAPAEVTLRDGGVLLTLPDSIPDGLSPAWVSLGWDDYAEIHIFNRSGLSAAPFKLKVKAPADCSSLSQKENHTMKKQAFNPFLPSWEYIPDGEPHVFGDRVYLYGSHDHFRGYVYCLGDYVCWSAPVDDLSDWRYEGVIYRKEQDPRNTDGKMTLFAPDVVQGPDGRYYMYYIPNLSHIVSVAVCDTPAGAYEFYGFVRHADGTILGEREGDAPQFDPAVYREGDTVYLYTGFCTVENASVKGSAVTILGPDMLTVRKEPETLIPNFSHAKGTSFEGHAFFEASSLRKRGDLYYFIYSSVHNHELCYATSSAPTGPFTYRGVIVDNCDVGIDTYKPAGLMTALHCNNHGSFTEISGRWYMFYHRSTNGTQFSRQACAEEIFFSPDGLIRQVEMTSCGLNGGPLKCGVFYDAYIACSLWNSYPELQKDEKNRPVISQDGNDGDELPGYVCNMVDGATAGFKYFDCRGITRIDIKARGYMDGCFQVRTSPDGEICATVPVSECNYWETFSAPCSIPDGTHAIYITHVGGRVPTLGGFRLY